MKKRRNTILLIAIIAALSLLVNCSKPDRSEEATQLKNELQDILFSNPEQVLERVDSAELAGVFTETTANLIRSNVYGRMGKTQLALFYGEQIKHSPQLRSEGVNYYSALLQLTSLLNKNGEWGKAIHLADEIIADADQGGLDEQMVLRECAGVTPTDFINAYRLRHAARLLATTSDSVALIAELCGLSRRTFYRLFDEAYSMSPSDYRKAAKK